MPSKSKTSRRKKAQRRSTMGVETMQLTVAGVPRPSGGELVRPRYNPTWNPQYLKVARRIMYSVPAADVVSPYIQDPSVGCSATNLSFNTGAISFRISDVYNVTEYGALFDQYRIAAVKLEFHYVTASQSALTTTVSNQQNCSLCLYEDYDDSTSPPSSLAGWNAMLESGRAKVKTFPCRDNKVVYTLNPKYLTADVDTSATTTARSTNDNWVDGSTALDVVWRGLKWSLQANPGSTTIVHSFRVYETFFLCFRQRQ